MRIQLFASEDNRTAIADWVELQVFANSTPLSHADLARSVSVQEEPEHGTAFDEEIQEALDAEILDAVSEELVERVYEELAYRASVLGGLYPFVLATSLSGGWRLLPVDEASGTRLAHSCYLACLIISSIRRGLLPRPPESDLGRQRFDLVQSSTAHHFQAVSYLSAPALMGGVAHWFGWPRPDETTKMRAALEKLVERLGIGVLKEKDPEWVSGYEKDGTVDLVAWRPFLDGLYAPAVIMGQVASGANWKDKPVEAYIRGHFFDWFVDKPAERVIPALFMPFVLHDDARESTRKAYRSTAHGLSRQYERDYGVLVDRLRMTELAGRQLRDAPRPARADWQLVTAGLQWLRMAREYAGQESD